MDDEVPTDVPGHVEIHHATRNEKPNELDYAGPSKISNFEFVEAPPAKKRILSLVLS